MDIHLFTKRLKLSPFSLLDKDMFYDLNTDPFVRQYLWDDQCINRKTAHQILKQNESHFKNDQFGIWKIILQSSFEVIGFTGLWYFFDEPQPQLIYALKKPFTGQGFATEAAQAVIDYSFSYLDFNYLLAAMDGPHHSSQKVAERLGMKPLEQRVENGKPTIFYKINKA